MVRGFVLLILGLVAAPKNLVHAAPREDCASCHRAQALPQPSTSMGRALEAGAACDILIANPRMMFRQGIYSYEIVRDGARSLYKVTDGHETVTVPIDWAFGLGAAGQTYVFQRNGRWYESRVSFYQKVKGLDVTMGSLNTTPSNIDEAAGRLMSVKDESDCFGCHATGAVRDGRLDAGHLTPGVQCERCHGDAHAHVTAFRTGGDIQRAAMRPLGRLSTEEISDFCGQCHRTWSQIAMEGPHDLNNVRFQPYRLTNSKCYDAADARIRCVSCHDPHRELEKNSGFYDSKCQACHTAQAGPAKSPARRAVVCPIATKDCVTCHMPKYELPGSHNLFSDHRIRIVRAGEQYPE
jgi:cytochrome c554/c'-like protein